jgi:hypothetical protein
VIDAAWLDERKRAHDATNSRLAANVRARVREACAAAGVDAPTWAAPRTRSERGTVSGKKSNWKGRWPEPERTAHPVALDALLSDWRAARTGRIVRAGQRGIELWEADAGAKPLRFKDADAALEFLTRP